MIAIENIKIYGSSSKKTEDSVLKIITESSNFQRITNVKNLTIVLPGYVEELQKKIAKYNAEGGTPPEFKTLDDFLIEVVSVHMLINLDEYLFEQHIKSITGSYNINNVITDKKLKQSLTIPVYNVLKDSSGKYPLNFKNSDAGKRYFDYTFRPSEKLYLFDYRILESPLPGVLLIYNSNIRFSKDRELSKSLNDSNIDRPFELLGYVRSFSNGHIITLNCKSLNYLNLKTLTYIISKL